MQTHKVQSRLSLDQTAPVLRIAVPCEDGKIDPVEARIEAGAPDQVGDLQSSTVCEQGQAIAHADHARHTPHAGRFEVAGLDANEWRSPVERARPDLAAE